MLPTIVTVNPMRRSHRRTRRHRRHNPESRRRRVKAAKAGWRRRRHANPLARRRRHRRNPLFARRHRASRRHHRRYRNPFQRQTNEVVSMLVPAGIGAVSAVALDVIVAYLPLPTAVATGWGNIAVKAVGAIGLGFIAGMVAGKRNGVLVGAGALTVVGYDAVKMALAPTLGTSIKGLSGLADFGDYTDMGAYMAQPGAVGAYMTPQVGMGAYMNPSPYVALPAAAAPATGHPAAMSPVAMKQRMAGLGRIGNTANF